jgi:hypothetical protein
MKIYDGLSAHTPTLIKSMKMNESDMAIFMDKWNTYGDMGSACSDGYSGLDILTGDIRLDADDQTFMQAAQGYIRYVRYGYDSAYVLSMRFVRFFFSLKPFPCFSRTTRVHKC